MSFGLLIFFPSWCEASVVTTPSGSTRHTEREAQPATHNRPWRSNVSPLALVEGWINDSVPTPGFHR